MSSHIPVNGDTTEMENTGGAAHHITRYPEVTSYRPPGPVPNEVVDYSEWHHQTGHGYVAER